MINQFLKNPFTKSFQSKRDYEDPSILKESILQSDVLINGTNIGMAPNNDACIIPDVSYFHQNLTVADIIYNPRTTKLMKIAADTGLKTFNGMNMLLYQGAEAFRLWTGMDMPSPLIKEHFLDE